MGKIYGQLQDMARGKLIPIDVMMELTYGCNLKCVHCYNAPDPSKKEMTASEILGILGQIADAGGLMLTFTGGESLSRSDFFEIAAGAKKLGFSLSLISNGSLIDRDAAARLAEICFTDVSVTLYSMDPARHDAVTRRPGSWEKSFAALNHLADSGVKTTVRSVIMKPNHEGYQELISFAKEKGIRYLVDPHISPKQDGNRAPLDGLIDRRKMADVYLNDDMNFSLDAFPRDGFPDPDCDAGRSICAIDPYGNIMPCIQLPTPLGNLLERSFMDIWHNSEEAKKLRSIGREQMTECLSCDLGSYCLRCTGVAALEGNGLLGRSDAACASARIVRDLVADRK